MRLLLTFIVALSLFAVTGCKTSQKIIRTSSSAVEVSASAYALYVVQNDVPDADQDKFWEAYEKYIEAEDEALKAYGRFVVLGDEDAWAKAKEALFSAFSAYMKLVPVEARQ